MPQLKLWYLQPLMILCLAVILSDGQSTKTKTDVLLSLTDFDKTYSYVQHEVKSNYPQTVDMETMDTRVLLHQRKRRQFGGDCSPLNCGPPPSIENGDFMVLTCGATTAAVRYTCNSGYCIDGSATVACSFSGWAPEAPSCSVFDCGSPPSISNGSPGTPTSTTSGGTVIYSCNSGYVLVGSNLITCTCSSGGRWSSQPRCEICNCDPPPSISNGSPGTPTSTTFGGTVTYSCNSGYVLVGSNPITCTCPSGWSSQPTCEATCPDLPPLTNGVITYNPTSTPRLVGTTATYSCGNCYTGGTVRICQSDRTWSGGSITCQPSSCGSPPSISNGSPGTPTSTTFGGTVTYSCDHGYILDGSNTIFCTCSSGVSQWSSQPICIPVSCGSPPSISNGSPGIPTRTTFGGTVTYSCNPGYVLSGSATVTCQASRSWSTRPTCPAICPDLPPLNNGVITYSPTSTPRLVGNMATHSCDNRYVLSGGTVRRCQSDRTWSGGSITCQPITTPPTCSDLPPLTNGVITYTPSSTPRPEGTTATHSCDNGYELSGGTVRRCQSDRTWSGGSITCQAICPDLQPLTNGVITYSPTSTPRLQGTTVTYRCDNCYTLSGVTVSTCQSDRTWSGGSITCQPSSCGSPPSISNGSPGTPTSTTFGGTVMYDCNIGYRLDGPNTITCSCSSGGSWSSPPTCIPTTTTSPILTTTTSPILTTTTSPVLTTTASPTPTVIPILVEVMPPNHSPMYGKGYSLTCVVTGIDNPTVSYQWFKDGMQYETDSSSIDFKCMTLLDVGRYSCEAVVSSSQLTQDVRVVSDEYEPRFPSLNIQLRLNGILNCQQYTSSETNQKTVDITNGLVQGVDNLCGCGFSSTFISSPFLKCFEDSPQHVTYRAVLSETSDFSVIELLSYIITWTYSIENIVIQSVHVGINTICPILIVDVDSPECPDVCPPVITTTSSTTTIILTPQDPSVPDIVIISVSIAAGVLILLIIIAVIVGITVCASKSQSKAKSNSSNNAGESRVGELDRRHPYETSSQHPYETASLSHEYEDLDRYHQPQPSDYHFTHSTAYNHTVESEFRFTGCSAYLPSEVLSEREGQPSSDL